MDNNFGFPITNGGKATVLGYSGLWANRPSPEDMPVNSLIYIEDFPAVTGFFYIGSWWKNVANTFFSPEAGQCLVNVTNAPVTTADNTNEQILAQLRMPEGMAIPSGSRLESVFQFQKSNATSAATYRIRIGAAGNLTDTVVQSSTILAATRSDELNHIVAFPSGTTATVKPDASTTVWPAPVVISDIMDGFYMTLTTQMAVGGTITMNNSSIVLSLS